MKIFLALIFLFSNVVLAQQKLDTIRNDPDFNCKRTKNTSFEKLAVSFPLNQTTKIQIVSFEFRFVVDEETGEINEKASNDKLPIINNKLDYKKLKEYKDLELLKIIELSDLLYNFNFDPKKAKTLIQASCYEPRNSIVFLDSQDNIIDYIEICFGCGRYHSFKKTDFGEFCNGKIDLIKEFFFSAGIKHGVIEE